MSTQTEELRLRLADMERQLLALRRELTVARLPLPEHPFQILEVYAGGVRYGLPLASVKEVLQMLWCDPLPESPDWILGTFHYEGKLVPVVDLQRRLGYASMDLKPSQIIVILDGGKDTTVGLAADQLGDLPEVDPGEVRNAPAEIPQTPFLQGSIVDAEGAPTLLLAQDRICHDCLLEVDIA